jgi:hypothetical protein
MPIIDFACNDPDNGMFAGEVWCASVTKSGVGCDLETDFGRPFTFSELPGAIRLHRRVFKITGSKEWVGNWCWNSYRLEYPEYKRLLITMAEHGWRCTGGLTRWTNAFDALSERRRAA